MGEQEVAVRPRDPRAARGTRDAGQQRGRRVPVVGVPGRRRQRGGAAQPVGLRGLGPGAGQPLAGDHGRVPRPAQLQQRAGEEARGGGVPPRMVHRRGQRERAAAVAEGPVEVAGQPVEPAEVGGEVAGVRRVAAAAVELHRLLDPRPRSRPVARRGGHERRVEHRPLQHPGVLAPAERGLELGHDLAQPFRVPEVAEDGLQAVESHHDRVGRPTGPRPLQPALRTRQGAGASRSRLASRMVSRVVKAASARRSPRSAASRARPPGARRSPPGAAGAPPARRRRGPGGRSSPGGGPGPPARAAAPRRCP